MRSSSAAILIALALFAGCSDTDDPPPDTATDFYGTYADESGAIGTISLRANAVVSTAPALLGQSQFVDVTGEVTPRGAVPVPLTGELSLDDDYMLVSSAGDDYAFDGELFQGVFSGEGGTPLGAARHLLFIGATASSVTTLCGSATCTAPNGCTETASLSLAIKGAVVLVTANFEGTTESGTGTVSGTQVHAFVQDGFHTVRVELDGELAGTSAAGTWSNESPAMSGSWSASVGECNAAPTSR